MSVPRAPEIHAERFPNPVRSSFVLAEDLAVDIPRRLRQWNVLRSFAAPGHNFDRALRKLFSNRNAVWNADQIRVLELHAGTFVAVVKQRVEADLFALVVQSRGSLALLRIGKVHRRDYYLKRRDRNRQRHP